MAKEKIVYPYIPNSVPEIKAEMMKVIGITDEMELYRDIPEQLRYKKDLDLPEPKLDEYSIRRHTLELLNKNANTENYISFLGAGCAKHYTPAICDEMTGRGEFLTAYAGATMGDRGKWQAIWEYQAQMSELLDVDFIGFPQYDGPWALAHVMRMVYRITGRSKVLVPKSINPETLLVAQNYVDSLEKPVVDIVLVDYNPETGLLDLKDLQAKISDDVAAIVIENPNFFGMVETQAEEIGQIAKKAGAEFVVYADPISLGVMETPVNYGAAITCGDLHSLGCHVAAGGCHGGFVGLPNDQKYLSNYKDLAVSVYPTVEDGEYAFIWHNWEEGSYGLREDANEFTGTASNLWAIHAAVYLTLMGPKGMEEVGNTIMKRSQYAANRLSKIKGVEIKFQAPFFQEFVLSFDKTGKTVGEINKGLLEYKIFGGKDLIEFPELGQSALYCVTEVVTKEDIDKLAWALEKILG
ncbi:MAG: aminomethyl-transferring glycine dehydrogenase subunit GcvPA [Syntrophomonadaceae bacterium]|nr:aminomethyl-transferring glycine dehydrogenase subunit GcvPA [Syntrophomonadaceae bacterium]MDD3890163.1 aminomethyl-transferring glycine dehydrogenase subunit GcvPA [Syntrophomonadaceae bacterium]